MSTNAQVNAAALQVFFGLSARWSLTGRQERILLGDPPLSTYCRWKRSKRGRLTVSTLERISHLAAIARALSKLLPPKQADAWMAKPNEAFDGRSALAVMIETGIPGLLTVRRYLEAECH
jgi:uncharacterized protein (DUF2384 family)